MRTMLAALAAAAAFAAGCGGGGEDEQGAAPGEAAAPTSDRAVQFAECMRENGVPEFPDPVNGRIMLRAGPGGIRPDSPEFKAAQEACQEFAPEGQGAGGGQNADRQAQALRFAKCMRENGVPGFPDPEFSGGGVRMRLPQGVSEDSPEFAAARQACQKHMSGSGGAP